MHSVPSSPRNAAARGFTLLELLVAMAIGATVLAALYAAFFSARTAADATGSTVRMVFQSRMNLDRMRRELEALRFSAEESAMAIRVEDIRSFGRPASTLAFATLAYPGGLREIRYRLEEDRLQQQIIDPLTRLAEQWEEPPWLTILDDVREFLVEIRLNGRWIRTWDSELNPTVPQVFRLTIAYGDEEHPERVTAVAVPRIGGRP